MSTFRNRLFQSIYAPTYKIVGASDAVAGDVCMYDSNNEKMILVHGEFKEMHFPMHLYTPIGVVVVPGNHEVYGKDTCSVVSLVNMSCTTPSSGTLNEDTMAFGPQTDLSTYNYTTVIIKDDGVMKGNGFGYLSKNGVYNSTTLKIPDPYTEDMGRNPDYYDVKVAVTNAMSDFAGASNTTVIVKTRGTKNYSSWIPTYNTATDYPAASCCNMFYTVGTEQGDWYLPAAGEWGYITSKWDQINNAITMLNKNYGEQFTTVKNNSSYWTSSEYSGKNARYVHTDNGMGHTLKTGTNKVRAFLKVKTQIA